VDKLKNLIKNEYKNDILDDDYKEWTIDDWESLKSSDDNYQQEFNAGGYKWYHHLFLYYNFFYFSYF